MNKLRLRPEFEKILKGYRASEASQSRVRQAKIALFDGPSASGRNTIIAELVATGSYHQIVSDTTRLPRSNNGVQERDGIEYWFKTEEEFLAGLQKGAYIEAAVIHNQQISGVSVAEIERAEAEGRIAINDIQSDGVEAFRLYNPDIFCFFIIPPSFAIWQQRLRARGTMTIQEHQRRLGSAVREIEHALSRDFYHFVINDELATAVQRVEVICRGCPKVEDTIARSVAQELLTDIKGSLAQS